MYRLSGTFSETTLAPFHLFLKTRKGHGSTDFLHFLSTVYDINKKQVPGEWATHDSWAGYASNVFFDGNATELQDPVMKRKPKTYASNKETPMPIVF